MIEKPLLLLVLLANVITTVNAQTAYTIGLPSTFSGPSIGLHNLATETLDSIAPRLGSGFGLGRSTYDYVNQKYIYYGIFSTPTIPLASYVLDITTGQYDTEIPSLSEVEYSRLDNKFYGLVFNSNYDSVWYASTEYGATGYDTLAILPFQNNIEAGSSTFDAYNNRHFIVMDSTVLVIDATTGNVQTSWPSNGWIELEYDLYSQKLYALNELSWVGDWAYGVLDPATGVLLDSTFLFSGFNLDHDHTALDPINRRYYITGSYVDLNTGLFVDLGFPNLKLAFPDFLLPLDVSIFEENTIPINIYPQPASTSITADTPLVNPQYSLHDQLGRQVQHGQLTRNNTISTNNLTPGIYYLKVWNDEGAVGASVLIGR